MSTTPIAVTQDEALLPCPFCGGGPEVCQNGASMHWILCRACHACPGDKETRYEATTAWNTRTNATAELLAALKEARGQVVGFMLECGHSPEAAVANVARLDTAISRATGDATLSDRGGDL